MMCESSYGSLFDLLTQDHPDKIQKAIRLLLELVKYNPDIGESVWQCTTAGMVICMSMRGASG